MQPGDVPATYADVDDLVRDVGFEPARRSKSASSGSWSGTGASIVCNGPAPRSNFRSLDVGGNWLRN